jgi:subtilase family serine protease
VTSVGGTDLNTTGAGSGWSSETAWSDSGGGISPDKFAIPSWQTAAAAGCSSCSKTYRNGPDVSANANFTYYVCADQTTCTANEYGGTSFAAPLWAGYLALVNQQAKLNGATKGVGFINPSLYTIGAGSSYGSDFHDITSGSNGYSATTGYDLVTGWGSPNGSGLINALGGPPSTTPSFSLSSSPGAVSVVKGSSGTSSITSAIYNSFSSAVALSASGQPAGVTVGFNPPSIASPGSGSSTVTFTVASNAATGTYPITITGTGGGLTETTTVSLTVTAPASPAFTVSVSPTSGSLDQGQSGYAVVTTAVSGGFNSSISLSATGLPSGVTGSFSPNPIAAPGSGTSDFTLKVARTAPTGTHTITITATGGGITHTTTLSFTVLR